MKISAIIIARNEAEMIGEAIDSLKFTDEIVVIDSGSTDKTLEILQRKKVKIYRLTQKEINFADLRNIGLQKVSGDYVLYLDADERISPELAIEIKQTVESKNFSGFRIPRRNFYLGRPWSKIEQLERLFKRNRLIGWYGEVHESPEVEGDIGTLHHYIYHYTHRSLKDMVDKTLKWSKIEAELRFKSGHPKVSWWRFPKLMLTQFVDYYIFQSGYKVGTVGLIESMYQAFSIFITYARLWEMQNNLAEKDI